MVGTLNNNQAARDFGYNAVQFLRKRLLYTDTGAKTIGTIPAGSLILKPLSGIQVHVVTNAGTANVIDIGTTADDDLYGTDMSTAAIAFVPLDEAVTTYVSSDTTITATMGLTGTAATTGDLEVVIAFITGGR